MTHAELVTIGNIHEKRISVDGSSMHPCSTAKYLDISSNSVDSGIALTINSVGDITEDTNDLSEHEISDTSNADNEPFEGVIRSVLEENLNEDFLTECEAPRIKPILLRGASREVVFHPDGAKELKPVMVDQREIDIENGLYNEYNDDETCPRTVIRVEPVEGDSSLFCVRMMTGHYAFSLKKSSTLRRLKEFYQIESVLKWRHPYVLVPSMPLRPLLWLSGQETKLRELATFLSLVLTQRQLLSNRGLHLFLQTQLSMDVILKNLDGERDDQVVEKDKYKPCEGFKELFGNAFKEGNKRTFEYHCQ